MNLQLENNEGSALIGVDGDQLQFTTASSGYYFDGNVGIGATSPGAKLDVRGSAIFNEDGDDADFRIESDTNANHFISDAGLFSGVGAFSFGAVPNGLAYIRVDNPAMTSAGGTNIFSKWLFNAGNAVTIPTGSSGTHSSMHLREPVLTKAGTFTGLATTLYIESAPTEGATNAALYVDAGNTILSATSGNVGVGTTSPYALLSVGGNVVVGASSAGGTLGDLYLPKLGTAAGTFLAVDAGGKVIATSTPVGGSASSTLLTDDNTFTGANIFSNITLSTTTQATSTNFSVTTAINLMGEVITDFTAYVRALFTGGDGITITSGDIDCDTADTNTFGCLTSTDWDTFNGKQDTITAGDNLTLTGTNIDLDATLTGLTGITSTGLLDFGGGVLEIPNGASPTADDVGELAHDTTDNQLVLDDRIIRTSESIFGFTMASTSVEFVSGGQIPVPLEKDGYTVTNIKCYVQGGTSVQLTLTDGTNAMDTLTCATTATSDDGAIANSTVTADELMYVNVGTISGTPDYVTFRVFGNWTRE